MADTRWPSVIVVEAATWNGSSGQVPGTMVELLRHVGASSEILECVIREKLWKLRSLSVAKALSMRVR